mmetsp:Transcript_22110/g.40639  ORF Transcript_22110/g.40639 Transcript_22110/m.40639 type:complete len:606 (+) Transcript_22110:93-1910(+)
MPILDRPISWVGRTTEKELLKLRAQAKVKPGPDPTLAAEHIGSSKTKSKDHSASDGALAKDVQDFLRQKRGVAETGGGSLISLPKSSLGGEGSRHGSRPGSRADSRPLTETSPTSPTRLSAVFMSPYFVDNVWHGANRNLVSGVAVAHTTQNSPLGPGRYRPSFGQVNGRAPAWDFSEKVKTTRRDSPSVENEVEGGEATPGGLFRLTGVDMSDPSSLSPKQRSGLRASLPHEQLVAMGLVDPDSSKPCKLGMMSLSTGRDAVIMRAETPPVDDSLHEAIEDFLKQDIVAFNRPRTPDVDFNKYLGRDAVPDRLAAPGDYKADWKIVAPTPKTGVTFERALPRDAAEPSGPQRMLMPLNHHLMHDRITHVADFSKDLPRPALSPPKVYHVETDPVACASVYDFEMNFDINKAAKAVMHRCDAAPDFKLCLPRSRSAVQGVRILLKDLGVRGAFGLAMHDNKISETSVERREARKAAGRSRPDIGPKMAHQFLHPTAHVGGTTGKNPNRGHLVQPMTNHKQAPRLTTKPSAFHREAAQQGFEKSLRVAAGTGRPQASNQPRARSRSPGSSPRKVQQASPVRETRPGAQVRRERAYEALDLAAAGLE